MILFYKFHHMTQKFGNNQTFVIVVIFESPKIACVVAYSSEPCPGITVTSEYISILAVIGFNTCNTVTLLSFATGFVSKSLNTISMISRSNSWSTRCCLNVNLVLFFT